MCFTTTHYLLTGWALNVTHCTNKLDGKESKYFLPHQHSISFHSVD